VKLVVIHPRKKDSVIAAFSAFGTYDGDRTKLAGVLFRAKPRPVAFLGSLALGPGDTWNIAFQVTKPLGRYFMAIGDVTTGDLQIFPIKVTEEPGSKGKKGADGTTRFPRGIRIFYPNPDFYTTDTATGRARVDAGEPNPTVLGEIDYSDGISCAGTLVGDPPTDKNDYYWQMTFTGLKTTSDTLTASIKISTVGDQLPAVSRNINILDIPKTTAKTKKQGKSKSARKKK
jgi:hypothetical protein